MGYDYTKDVEEWGGYKTQQRITKEELQEAIRSAANSGDNIPMLTIANEPSAAPSGASIPFAPVNLFDCFD